MSTIAFKQDNFTKIDFDVSPLFEGVKSLRSGAIDIKNLYRIYRLLSTLEFYIKYAVVNESDIDSVEEALSVIDDTIDDVEEEMRKTNIFKKFLFKKILSKLLTIEFILSNKVADYIGENHQNQTL